MKLAIVGRPNAGKSTLINRMIGEDRLITGPEAGITRDSIRVDWQWEKDGEVHEIQLFDTAGMRRRSEVQDKREKLSVADALHAGEFAGSSCCCSRDQGAGGAGPADCRPGAVGRPRADRAEQWDVAEEASALFNGVRNALDDGLSQVKGVPIITVSGATGKGIDTLFASRSNSAIWSGRVSTAKLNRWFEGAVDASHRPRPAASGLLRYIRRHAAADLCRLDRAPTRCPAVTRCGQRDAQGTGVSGRAGAAQLAIRAAL